MKVFPACSCSGGSFIHAHPPAGHKARHSSTKDSLVFWIQICETCERDTNGRIHARGLIIPAPVPNPLLQRFRRLSSPLFCVKNDSYGEYLTLCLSAVPLSFAPPSSVCSADLWQKWSQGPADKWIEESFWAGRGEGGTKGRGCTLVPRAISGYDETRERPSLSLIGYLEQQVCSRTISIGIASGHHGGQTDRTGLMQSFILGHNYLIIFLFEPKWWVHKQQNTLSSIYFTATDWWWYFCGIFTAWYKICACKYCPPV